MQPEPTQWRGVHWPEFRTWILGSNGFQSPAEELLAEHHLAAGVILAMEEGANRLLHGDSVPGFWSDVVEFIGNFMHVIHRAKEARCYGSVVDTGLLGREESAALEQEHDDARQTTLELIDAVEQGDWEGTYRHVAFYAHVMRPHMEHEERTLIPAMRLIDPDARVELRAALKDVEAAGMNGRSRMYYLDLARRLCSQTEVRHRLG